MTLTLVPPDPQAQKFFRTVKLLDAESRAVVSAVAAAFADPNRTEDAKRRLGEVIDCRYISREAFRAAVMREVMGGAQ